ncbi:MAG: TraR/DksA C4-type zinc finger protein [Anaerolineae bacterium]|nr:TraR/DksA C4-type zinc finger protein [Anaerolineae bacterium]
MLDIQGTQRFHGHMCPGLAIGIRAAEIALREIGQHSADEEIVAIVETDMCGVDAIQYLTGCTFGKGNLIHLDYGKNAFTFIRRSDGKALRLLVRSNAMGARDLEHSDLFAKVLGGEASPEERARFQALHAQRAQQVLDLPENQLFEVQAVTPHIPQKARILKSLQCAACGEMVMETRTRNFRGQVLCLPCFQARENRM